MEPVRTLLFVPGHRDRMLEKAPGSGADGLLYDLEDSVPAPDRATARAMLADALSAPRTLPRYIRVNGIADAGKDETAADLQAVILADVDGIVLPKAQSAGRYFLDGGTDRRAGKRPRHRRRVGGNRADDRIRPRRPVRL